MVKDNLIQDIFIFESENYKQVNNKRKGVLRTIVGPLAEWDNKNRNNRVYSEKLWDNVLNSDYVKEQLQYKTLYGEANHPSDRFEIDFARVSHNIVEMWKVPEKKQVYGRIDILDTPLGRILDTLYEYGSIIGFSSRAGGVLKKKNGYIEVDENNYRFITFDAVPYPSVKAARLISEGASSEECIIELSDEVHEKLLNIIENSSQNDREILLSFIYELQGYDLSKEIEVLESYVNNSANNGNNVLKDTTLYLLKENYRNVYKLKEENNKLKEELQYVKENLDTVMSENISLEKEVKELKDKLVKLVNENSKNKSLLKSKAEELESLKDTISLNEVKQVDLDLLQAEVNELRKLNLTLERMIKDSENKIKVLESENNSLHNKINEMKEEYKKNNEIEYNGALIALGDALEENHNLKDKIETLLQENEEIKANYNKILERNEELEKEVYDLQDVVEKLEMRNNNEIVRLNEETNMLVEEYENKISLLEEEYDRLLDKYERVLENYKKDINMYKLDLVKTVCSIYNVDVEDVIERLNEDYTLGDIHLVCEELSSKRKEKLSFIVESENVSKRDNVYKSRLGDIIASTYRR